LYIVVKDGFKTNENEKEFVLENMEQDNFRDDATKELYVKEKYFFDKIEKVNKFILFGKESINKSNIANVDEIAKKNENTQ